MPNDKVERTRIAASRVCVDTRMVLRDASSLSNRWHMNSIRARTTSFATKFTTQPRHRERPEPVGYKRVMDMHAVAHRGTAGGPVHVLPLWDQKLGTSVSPPGSRTEVAAFLKPPVARER